jgi:DNA helicase-2/ATP-dependent DNA helicase PcrA
VGITRARERLYLCHAWSRMLFGSTDYYPPSRFLSEIPEELVHAQESAKPIGRGRSHREAVVEAALAASAPAGARGAESLGIRVGDDVAHEKFGEGVVLELIGDGDKTEAVVNFPEVGEKRLLLAWAPLQKI